MILSAVRDPYPTRDLSEGALIRRVEPVIYNGWNENAPLSEEQYKTFDQKGYLVIPNVFDDKQVSMLRQVGELLSENAVNMHPEQVVLELESKACRTLFGVHQINEVVESIAKYETIQRLIQFILNDDFYVYQSRFNFKSAFYGSGFEWHSDFETWHAEDGMPSMRAVSATILLNEEFEGDGALKVMPGSHKTFLACPGQTPDEGYKDRLQKQTVGKPPALLLDLMRESCGVEQLVAQAGSLVLCDCNLMHGAGANTSQYPRSNLFFVYNALSNVLTPTPYAADEPRPAFIAARK